MKVSRSPYEVMADADMKYHSEHGELPKQYPSSSDADRCIIPQKEIEESLSAIMGALSANPNCSQDELFQCCANAFEIAEATLQKLRQL